MPPIKLIALDRLIELFGQSVNALPEGPVRQLAAQLMTLTAHSVRIDQKIDARVKELGAQIVTLTEIVETLAQRQGPAAPAPAPKGAPKDTAPAAPAAAEQEEEPTPDDEFEARLRAEVEAEVAAANAANGEHEVVGVQ